MDQITGSLLLMNLTAINAGQTVEISSYSLWPSAYLMLAGTGRYEVTCRLNAGYDFPTSAKELFPAGFGTDKSFNDYASVSADEPTLAVPVANTIWFKWTPSFTGGAILDTN
jgi:hypothetical protein